MPSWRAFATLILKRHSEEKRGDIIKEIDGIKINKFSDLSGHLSTKRPGDKVNVIYSRENQLNRTIVTLKKVDN